MKELVCIVCPRGCTMNIEEKDGEYLVSGNFCKRGEAFAKSEMTNPMRTICTTVATSFEETPVIPVRVSSDIPKSRIFDVMNEINKVIVTELVRRGDVIIPDILGLGVDVIATSDMMNS